MPLPVRSECDRCAALCCVAFPAQAMPGFALSKDAGEPCPHLDGCGKCLVYSRRVETGFAGCIDFECFGAGQYVTQVLFDGQDWRDEPAVRLAMCEAFLACRRGFELLALVDHARNRGLPPDTGDLEDAIERWIEAPLAAELPALEARLRAILAPLR